MQFSSQKPDGKAFILGTSSVHRLFYMTSEILMQGFNGINGADHLGGG